jgi:orotate phosphoribosyltransferase
MAIDFLNIFDLFTEKGALLEGHFVLSSGLHSDRYLQTALLLQHPDVAAQIGATLAETFKTEIEAVLSPAIGGIVIGQETARAIGCRAMFTEKDDAGKTVLRRGFEIKPGEKILVVEDVITTGLSSNEVINLVKAAGGKLVGIGSVVNRSGKKGTEVFAHSVPVHSLLEVNAKTWDPKECPLCKQGIPAVKPGSRKK